MDNQLKEIRKNSLDMWQDQAQLQEIKKIISQAPLTDLEFKTFCHVGKTSGLNPFLREMWAVKYKHSSPAQIFIGRDGYRKAAQRDIEYDYHQADAVYSNDIFKMINGIPHHEYTLTDRGHLVGAYCIAKRHKSSQPMFVFVDFKEYNLRQSMWQSKPATMIKKVAESQCLRACFQDVLGGTYTPEEVPISRVYDTSPNAPEPTSQTAKLKNIIQARSTKNEKNAAASGNTAPPIDVEAFEVSTEQGGNDEGVGSNPEEKIKVHNPGKADEPADEADIEEIYALMDEQKFTPERIDKALKYFKVTQLENLSDADAKLMLVQLKK
jgi:phage recombination protein Bet